MSNHRLYDNNKIPDCILYYKKAFDDNGIILLLKNKDLNIEKFNFNIIIIDEIQDLNSLYYQLICKILYDNTSEPNILLLGDKNQCINTWNNSDWRYLKYSNYQEINILDFAFSPLLLDYY